MKQRLLAALLLPAVLCAFGAQGVLAQEPYTYSPDNNNLGAFEVTVQDKVAYEGPMEQPIDADGNPVGPPVPVEEPLPRINPEVNAAASLLTDSFETDGSGQTQYPEEYAAHWVTPDAVVVGLTTDDAAVRQRYLDLMGNPDCVEFRVLRYSQAEAAFLRDLAARKVREAGLTWYSASPGMMEDGEYVNRAILEVPAEQVNAVWEVLHRDINTADFFGSGFVMPRIDDAFDVRPGEPIIVH